MSERFDAVIIGGGHNGLVCGAYLAKAGQRVCVLERRPFVGGAAVTEELWPGYRLSTASYTQALLQPKVILDLDLKRHGYEVLKPPPMFMLLLFSASESSGSVTPCARSFSGKARTWISFR